MVVSPDCQTWQPEGFDVSRAHFTNGRVETEKLKSLTRHTSRKSRSVDLSVGVSIGSFSAGLESRIGTSSSLEQSKAVEHSYYLTKIEMVDSHISFSLSKIPPLADAFADPIEEYVLEHPVLNDTADTLFVLSCLARNTMVPYKAELGCRRSQIVIIASEQESKLEASKNSFSVKAKAESMFV